MEEKKKFALLGREQLRGNKLAQGSRAPITKDKD